jgi:RimJ/RimL family protein N-acetyltransferase
MAADSLLVREITSCDIPRITAYWLNASAEFLLGMGVDSSKIPGAEAWETMLSGQISQPYLHKKAYCLIWELNGIAIGHTNLNPVEYGQEAYMHLHLWNTNHRKAGLGLQFILKSLPFYFEHMQIQQLYCQPYAPNEAPNKTLARAGFNFVKKYSCSPGWLNFEQEVNLWQMTKAEYKKQI